MARNAVEFSAESYEKTSPVGAALAPAVQETAHHLGVINPTPAQQYEQAQYLFESLSEAKDRISKFAKAVKMVL